MNYIRLGVTPEMGGAGAGPSPVEAETPALEDSAGLILEAELIVAEAQHASSPLISLMNTVRFHREEAERMEDQLVTGAIHEQNRPALEMQAILHRQQLVGFGAKLAFYGFRIDDVRGSLKYAGPAQ